MQNAIMIMLTILILAISACKKSEDDHQSNVTPPLSIPFKESFERDSSNVIVPDKSNWTGAGVLSQNPSPGGGEYSLALYGTVYWIDPEHHYGYLNDSVSTYISNISGTKILELSAYRMSYGLIPSKIKLRLHKSGIIVKEKLASVYSHNGNWELMSVIDTMDLELKDSIEIQLYKIPDKTRNPTYFDLVELKEL